MHGIATQWGGHVEVSSEVGVGTTFEVYFPRALESPAPLPLEAPRESPAWGSETVLVVEDDESVAEVTQAHLTSAGYTVLLARSPKDALAIWIDSATDVQLLLTDVVMPEMNGRALADRLRKTTPGLPVLYVSGYTTDAIVDEGVLEAGIDFLRKPHTRDQLLARVRGILDRAR